MLIDLEYELYSPVFRAMEAAGYDINQTEARELTDIIVNTLSTKSTAGMMLTLGVAIPVAQAHCGGS